MFQSLHISPPRRPRDGYFADTTVHLEIADPALVANWLLAFLRGRCVFIRIDFVKCTLRVRINESLIKLRIFYDVMNTTPVSVSPREGEGLTFVQGVMNKKHKSNEQQKDTSPR